MPSSIPTISSAMLLLILRPPARTTSRIRLECTAAGTFFNSARPPAPEECLLPLARMRAR